MSGGISQSRFYMWRAVFAMAHADHEISPKEQAFMRAALDKENFTREQRAVLESDIEESQSPGDMFMQIAEQEDRSRFFYYARMLESVEIELADNHREMLAEDMRDDSYVLQKFLRRFKA